MINRPPPPPKFDRPAKRRIAADWLERFPGYVPIRPDGGSPTMVRRIGPVLQGVCLERRSDGCSYRPVSFVHFLGDPTGLALGLHAYARKENGATLESSVRSHDRNVERLSDLVRRNAAVDLDVIPTLDQILTAYRTRIEQYPGLGYPREWPHLDDLVLLPAVLGRTDLVAKALIYAGVEVSAWEPSVPIPDPAAWYRDLAARAADPDKVRRTVEEQVAALKLESVPHHELR